MYISCLHLLSGTVGQVLQFKPMEIGQWHSTSLMLSAIHATGIQADFKFSVAQLDPCMTCLSLLFAAVPSGCCLPKYCWPPSAIIAASLHFNAAIIRGFRLDTGSVITAKQWTQLFPLSLLDLDRFVSISSSLACLHTLMPHARPTKRSPEIGFEPTTCRLGNDRSIH